MGPPLYTTEAGRERALLIGVLPPGRPAWMVQDSLDELAQLADTAGAEVLERVVFRQPAPHPATFIGRGQAERLVAQLQERGANVVMFDDDLTPVQGRNLEQALGLKVLDRTQLILDIFARHARSRDGCLQVELAQAEYLLPRLRRQATQFGQQKGGIGLSGPGERQIEIDRRQLQKRMVQIRRALAAVGRRRDELRHGRRRQGWSLFTLIGYTNAGKSTLFNQLTGASVLADDQLFATLDPTTRRLRLPNRQAALITDTVGFIRKLPHHLIDAFQATLEEVIQADVLVHVVDAAHPRADEQCAAVTQVLIELGVHEKPIVTVLNKCDLPGAAAQVRRLAERLPRAVAVSALTGAGLDDALHALADCLTAASRQLRLRVPLSAGAFLAALRQAARIHAERYEADQAWLEVSVPLAWVSRCAPYGLPEDAP